MRNSQQAFKQAVEIIDNMDNYADVYPNVSKQRESFNSTQMECLNARLKVIRLFHPEQHERAWAHCVGTV